MSSALTLTVEPGQRFGRWTVIELTRTPPTSAVPYGRRGTRCRCDCGAERVVSLLNLVYQSRSCGCYRRERTIAMNRRLKPAQIRTHGLAKHYLYQTWATILKRCDNPAFRAYPR